MLTIMELCTIAYNWLLWKIICLLYMVLLALGQIFATILGRELFTNRRLCEREWSWESRLVRQDRAKHGGKQHSRVQNWLMWCASCSGGLPQTRLTQIDMIIYWFENIELGPCTFDWIKNRLNLIATCEFRKTKTEFPTNGRFTQLLCWIEFHLNPSIIIKL